MFVHVLYYCVDAVGCSPVCPSPYLYAGSQLAFLDCFGQLYISSKGHVSMLIPLHYGTPRRPECSSNIHFSPPCPGNPRTAGGCNHIYFSPIGGGGGGGLGGENLQGNFCHQEKWRNFPPSEISQRVTNNFTVNSDAGEYCEFRHVQRCTRWREGTKMCLFAKCSGCVTGMHWK